MSNTDDFDVAKAVADKLRGLDAERQSRILRWVSEGLGIAASISQRREPPGASPPEYQRDDPRMPSRTASDIRSFVAAKDPKSDNQFAATVAYYYRFEAPEDQRRESITSEMLQEATRLSSRSRLGDPGKTLRNAKDMGYLDAADRGEFKINSVGENLVAMTLPNQGRTVSAKAGRKSTAAKKKARKSK